MNIAEILVGKEYTRESVDMQNLLDTRRKVLLTKLIDKSLINDLRLGRAPAMHKNLFDLVQRQEQEIKKLTAQKNHNGYVWITISPKECVGLSLFRKKIEKLASRKMFLSHTYVYEQRGDSMDTLGKGLHAHMLCKRNLDYKPNKIVRNVLNTTKSIADSKAVDIQFVGEDFRKDKVEYMLGKKTGAGKEKKQDFDKIFRKKNNLKAFYRCRVK